MLLKLIYQSGKYKEDNQAYEFIAFHEAKSIKTVKKHITTLKQKGYLYVNKKTGYCNIKSFDRIRKENQWQVRLSYRINLNNYNKINAVTGAVIYGYLHTDFWRKVKKRKSVLLKGSTYHFPNFKFNYKDKFAPVSVIGVSQIFDISISTASRLKNEAVKEKLISVKKNYSKESYGKDIKAHHKHNDLPQNIVYRKGKYHLQLIDTVCPLFSFSKRNSLKT